MQESEKKKIRTDQILVQKGLFASREKAQAAVMAGLVYINGNKVLKSSQLAFLDDEIEVRDSGKNYVSRGALKLEKALKSFSARLEGKTVMDIGASTGGFTDVCLRVGAKHVYSIDVGYGQLDWKLRNDSRVTVMERTNARYIEPGQFPDLPTIAVMDVSFISVKQIIPAILSIIGPEGIIYSLIKPQFEAGRDKVGKKGVVRDPEVHGQVLKEIAVFCRENNLCFSGLEYSPITGPEGNIEFLAEIRPLCCGGNFVTDETIESVVSAAHEHLSTKRGNHAGTHPGREDR